MMFNRNSQPLTIDQIAQTAPSALALQPHESRSDRYTYIPTLDVIKGMERAGFFPFSATQSRSRDLSRREFTKHMLRFRTMADMQRAAIVGEVVPEIVLVNAHDGTSAYKLMMGLYRFICANGAMVSDSEVAAVHVQHKGNIIDAVVEASTAIVQQAPKVLDTVQRWQSLQLTAGEQNAFAEAAHTLRFADAEGHVDTPITASQLLWTRRGGDNSPDLWRTFNKVQENVIKGGLSARAPRTPENRHPRLVSTREVKGIDQDVKLNRALWQLAERMAELKTGIAVAA